MSRQPTDAAMMARYARADKRGAAAAGEARARSASPRGSGANQRIYEALRKLPREHPGRSAAAAAAAAVDHSLNPSFVPSDRPKIHELLP